VILSIGNKWHLNLNRSNNHILLSAVPEIEQGLADAAGSEVTVSFTPHLIPMVSKA